MIQSKMSMSRWRARRRCWRRWTSRLHREETLLASRRLSRMVLLLIRSVDVTEGVIETCELLC